MKKIIYSILSLAMVALASCSKDEPGGTNMQEMAGQWYVTMDGVDANGNIIMEDPLGNGRFLVLTFNTTNDDSDLMWVSDIENLYWTYYYYDIPSDFQTLVKVDKASMTFGNTDWSDNINYNGEQMLVTNGKIVKNGTTTPSGMPADYIWFEVKYSDQVMMDLMDGEVDHFSFSGYRYTGFVADE